MTPAGLLMCVPMIGLLTCAAATDVRSRRIPNWLTFSLVLAGLAQSFTAYRTVGPADALLGLLTGFGLTFVFFGLGAMGGGDVKLLAGVGAWLGPWGTLLVFAAEAVIGMACALVQAAAQRRLRVVLRDTALLAANLAAGDLHADHLADGPDGGPARDGRWRLPYAVPVLLATLWVVRTA